MKVSIIVLAHKDRGWLDRAILSAKAQNFDDYEIILSSDGNPDLEEYAKRHNIRFSLSMPETNYSTAFNLAVKRASGEWIKGIDDDDEITEDCLKYLYREAKECDLVYANAFHILNDKITRMYRGPAEVSINNFLPVVTNPLHWSTVLFNRQRFLDCGGFDDTIVYSDEYELYLNMLSKGYKFRHCDKVVCYYRIHNQQKTATIRPLREKEIPYIKQKYGL